MLLGELRGVIDVTVQGVNGAIRREQRAMECEQLVYKYVLERMPEAS